MSGYDGYKPEDNVRRKANNTGESIETIGQNKNVKAWTSAPYGTAEEQAKNEAEKYQALSSLQEVKSIPKENYQVATPRKVWCKKTRKFVTGEEAEKIFKPKASSQPEQVSETPIQNQGDSMISGEKVGKFFKDADGNVFELISYCEYPTATFRKVGTEVRVGGAVGSLNLKDFKLIPEDQQDTMRALVNQLKGNK